MKNSIKCPCTNVNVHMFDFFDFTKTIDNKSFFSKDDCFIVTTTLLFATHPGQNFCNLTKICEMIFGIANMN